jgi:hypothetical protein
MAGHLQHVTPGQPFRPPAGDWNTLVDMARLTGAGRTITRVPDSQPFPGNKIKLFVALQTFITGGDIDGPGTSGQRDYSRGWCAELKYDPLVLDGSALRYMRVDGWATVVWAPLGHSADAVATACGNQAIQCGERFYATYNATSSRWEPVSPPLPGYDNLTVCDCVRFGYATWEVIDGEWSLVANRCSGCYDASALDRIYLFPAERFTVLGINADWLQPPQIDAASVVDPEGRYYVTCCSPDEVPPPADDCNCCVYASAPASFEHTVLGTEASVTNSRILPSTGNVEPCAFTNVTFDNSTYPISTLGIQANHLSLWASYIFQATSGDDIHTTTWRVRYDIDGVPTDCTSPATYNFARVDMTGGVVGDTWPPAPAPDCLTADPNFSTSNTGSFQCVNYEFPASITIEPSPQCYPGGGTGNNGCPQVPNLCGYRPVPNGGSPTGVGWQALSDNSVNCGDSCNCVAVDTEFYDTHGYPATLDDPWIYLDCEPN